MIHETFGDLELRCRPLVLVAEDEDSVRLALCELLREAGYRALGVADGDELLREAARLRPAAVLMDLAMPHVNGIEAAAALRGDERTAEIRVIATTASWLGDRFDLLSGAGFDGAVRKPCSAVQIAAELSRVLESPAVSLAPL